MMILNWKSVVNFDTQQKFEATMKATGNILDQLERNIREVRRTTLLDGNSILFFDWLESCAKSLQLTIKNKDK